MAALFAVLVRALEKRGSISHPEVEAEIEKVYLGLRDNPTQSLPAMETLRWAGELLKI